MDVMVTVLWDLLIVFPIVAFTYLATVVPKYLKDTHK